MGLKGIILSGHNSTEVEEEEGSYRKLSSLKTSELRLVGLNCNFSLNIFVFNVSTSLRNNKIGVIRLGVSFHKERSMATIATLDLKSILELYHELKKKNIQGLVKGTCIL